jgi:tetratricopeptide (TPR) repeat protein
MPESALARAKRLYGQLQPEATLLARRLLEEAVADPGETERTELAECWALLGDILTCDYLNRWNGAEATEVRRAEDAVARALSLDPALPLAHYAQGFVCRAKGDHEAALAAYSRTLELNPDFARAYAHKAAELLYLGRLDEVAPLVHTAIERTPPGNLALGMFYWILGRAEFFAGRYRNAAGWLRRSIEVRPNLWYNRLYLVSALALTGETDEARETLVEFDRVFPGYTVARARRDEQTNPNHQPVVVAGRQQFHRGLILAGMKEA